MIQRAYANKIFARRNFCTERRANVNVIPVINLISAVEHTSRVHTTRFSTQRYTTQRDVNKSDVNKSENFNIADNFPIINPVSSAKDVRMLM